MKGIKILCGIILLLASCTNSADTSAERVDSAEQAEAVTEEATDVQGSFPGLFAYLSNQDSSFHPENFELTEMAISDPVAAQPLTESRLQPFYPYLIYNKDSSSAIDLFSYNHVAVDRDGKTVLEQGGPDTEVALIDPQNKTRKRIFFSGPGTIVLEARWLDNQTVLLAGAEELSFDAIRPLLWKISLPNREMQLFRYKDSIQANVGNYRDSL